MPRREIASMTRGIASFGLLLLIVGFSYELSITSVNYFEAGSESQRQEYFDMCVVVNYMNDEVEVPITEFCQEQVNDHVFGYMVEFMVSVCKVIGILFLWYGLARLRSNIVEAIYETENQVEKLGKRLVKVMREGIDEEE
jgi:hypothetical protein